MNRKGFLNSLLIGAAGVLVPAGKGVAKSSEKQKVRLGVEFIAGFQYYDGPDAEPLLEAGMPLQLNREPHNRYDRNAIEIWSGDAKLGYVPRTGNKPIARLMDDGVKVEAKILELDPQCSPYGCVKMELYYLRDVA